MILARMLLLTAAIFQLVLTAAEGIWCFTIESGRLWAVSKVS
jgi:hypothetical protein